MDKLPLVDRFPPKFTPIITTSSHDAMDGALAIILLTVCLTLLAAEVFLPSGGMILVSAMLCLFGSVWFAYRAWWENPTAWWAFIASAVILVPAVLGGILYWFPRTSMGKRVLLDGPTLAEVEGYTEETERLRALVGKRGHSISLMNPGGLALIDGERHHCESQGLLIEPKQPVEVVGVSGTRLIIRPISEREQAEFEKPAEPPAEPAASDGIEDLADDHPLDFEVPQS